MKLLYIANMRMPTEKAHSIQAMQMCAAFALYNTNATNCHPNVTNEIEVELMVPRRLNKIKESPFEYYGIERNFKLTKLPCLDLIPFLGHFGLWVETVSFQLSLFLYLLFKKVDIVYTRDKACLLPVFFKKNVFFEAHTFPRNYYLYGYWFKKAKGIITITKGLEELFLAKGIKPENILTAPDGVDLEKFTLNKDQTQCREKLGLPFSKKIVLYTGHLYSWKGVETLLQAAKNFQFSRLRQGFGGQAIFPPPNGGVPPKAGNFQTPLFVFVGGTEGDVKSFRFQVSGFRLENVLIIGQRPHAEIPYWLAAADVLVLPNSGKEEISRIWTSPLKMFEYMAAKKPIVASDLPSLREVLNENNAVLVEPDDALALAQGIKTILENAPLAKQIAESAFQDVQQYAWQARTERIVEFFNSSFL